MRTRAENNKFLIRTKHSFRSNFQSKIPVKMFEIPVQISRPLKMFETYRGMFPKTYGIDAESNSESIPHSFGKSRRTFFIFSFLFLKFFKKLKKQTCEKTHLDPTFQTRSYLRRNSECASWNKLCAMRRRKNNK